MRVVQVGEDFVTGEMLVEKRTRQIVGLLYGGVSSVLAETLASIGATLACDDDHCAVGVALDATHLNGIQSGKIVAITRPLKLGRRHHTWSIDIKSEEGKAICAARLT